MFRTFCHNITYMFHQVIGFCTCFIMPWLWFWIAYIFVIKSFQQYSHLTLITCQYFKTGGFVNLAGSEGYLLLWSTICPSNQHYLRFAYDGKVFQFKVLSFDLSSAPQCFYQDACSCCSSNSSEKHRVPFLSRRLPSQGFQFNNSSAVSSDHNLDFGKARVHRKLERIFSRTLSVSKVSGNEHRFASFQSVLPRGHGVKSHSMCQPVCGATISSSQAVHEVSESNRLGSPSRSYGWGYDEADPTIFFLLLEGQDSSFNQKSDDPVVSHPIHSV